LGIFIVFFILWDVDVDFLLLVIVNVWVLVCFEGGLVDGICVVVYVKLMFFIWCGIL